MNLLEEFPSFDSLALNLDSSLIDNFKTYYEEARFGLILIQDDFLDVNLNLRILEIGSGIGLLSNFLASKGFCVTAIEPSGQGFGFMGALQQHVQRFFHSVNPRVNFFNVTLEDFSLSSKFDYIFSINVLEHLEDPMVGLEKTLGLLKKPGSARFVAPNYQIPYEPHFNIPIIINKKWTYLIFKRHINTYPCSDPVGLWNSINWVTARGIEKYLKEKEIKVYFSRRALNHYLGRINEAGQFQKRKGMVFIHIAKFLRSGARFIPPRLCPVIDLKLVSK